MSNNAPRVLAHRGASGAAFENTLEAFRLARSLGADGVELDVHATRDGSLVVHHDPEIAGLGPIRELTAREVAGHRLPNGEPPPALPVALGELAGLEVWIEVKALPPEADGPLLGAVAGAGAGTRCGVHSFDHRIIARLRAADPALRLGVLSASYPVDPVAPIRAAGAQALWQEARLIDAELVEAVHRMGGELIAWTVNDEVLGRRLRDLGVDALCGNYPERLRFR